MDLVLSIDIVIVYASQSGYALGFESETFRSRDRELAGISKWTKKMIFEVPASFFCWSIMAKLASPRRFNLEQKGLAKKAWAKLRFRSRDHWLSKSAKLDIRGSSLFLCWKNTTKSISHQILGSWFQRCAFEVNDMPQSNSPDTRQSLDWDMSLPLKRDVEATQNRKFEEI